MFVRFFCIAASAERLKDLNGKLKLNMSCLYFQSLKFNQRFNVSPPAKSCMLLVHTNVIATVLQFFILQMFSRIEKPKVVQSRQSRVF